MLDKINYLQTENEKYPIVFTINVMESLQEKYGSFEKWSNLVQKNSEPNVKAIKFFVTEAINEGIDIENEKTHENRAFVTEKQVGRILTEIGIQQAAKTVRNTISQSILTENKSKNAKTTKNQTV